MDLLDKKLILEKAEQKLSKFIIQPDVRGQALGVMDDGTIKDLRIKRASLERELAELQFIEDAIAFRDKWRMFLEMPEVANGRAQNATAYS